jgi:ligand-binding sensor domain-containing protein
MPECSSRLRGAAAARWLTSSILVAITIGVAAQRASASEPISYSLKSWTTRDGLPGHLVRVFAQDRDGYLWVGTERGLARFDGFRFITWDLDGRLEGARLGVTALLAASDGSLWVSYSTVARVDRIQGDNVTTFLPTDGLIQGTVREIVEDREGQIWAGGRGGLSVFRGGSWRRVTRDSALERAR